MLSIPVTNHAVARMQQRAIFPEIVDFLLDYGRCEHHQRGAVLYYLDKRGRQRLEKSPAKRPIAASSMRSMPMPSFQTMANWSPSVIDTNESTTTDLPSSVRYTLSLSIR